MESRVDGARIAVREHGTEGAPLVLVHGGSGHGRWWDDVLAALGDRRALVPDLSGHGDSDHRERYLPGVWADEIAAVARLASTDGAGVHVVGHSMGGRMGALAAARHPDAIARLTLVDVALPLLPREGFPRVRPRREYPDRDAATAAFHLLPREPEDPARIARLAEHSVRADEHGVWTFKWDPESFADLLDQTPEEALGEVRCSVTSVVGTDSAITSPAMTAQLADALPGELVVVELAGGHHHLPLTHPSQLAALI